jgi:hypothetical protein
MTGSSCAPPRPRTVATGTTKPTRRSESSFAERCSPFRRSVWSLADYLGADVDMLDDVRTDMRAGT